MPTISRSQFVKQVRREILLTLRSVYPSALPADVLHRAVSAVTSGLAWDAFRAELVYLCDKGYARPRLHPDDPHARRTPWSRRWVRLTPTGVEVTDDCLRDEALDL